MVTNGIPKNITEKKNLSARIKQLQNKGKTIFFPKGATQKINHDFNDKTLTSDLLSSCLKYHIEKYKKDFPDINKLPPWRCTSVYNVQKYNPKDGFYKSHCEVTDKLSSIRILVWMIYLNTLQDGGTLFPTYQTGIRAKQGRLVIWPSYWTHMHKGQISPTETKYIATGWYEFN